MNVASPATEWGSGAAGSNPAVPKKKNPRLAPGFFFRPPRFRARIFALGSTHRVKSLTHLWNAKSFLGFRTLLGETPQLVYFGGHVFWG